MLHDQAGRVGASAARASEAPKARSRQALAWVKAVELVGLEEVRKRPGYHDEPLKGKRTGQRSIRLSKAYRAIYRIGHDGEAEVVEVIEANKHRY